MREIVEDEEILHIAILGDPGAGKSTLLQYIALEWINNLKYEAVYAIESEYDGNTRLPLLVELREYIRDRNNPENFLDFFHKGASVVCQLNKQDLDVLLRSGNAIVMFDGLDEVVDIHDRNTVINEIINFTNLYPRAKVIVTSRLTGYNPQNLAGADFHHFTLQDFDDEKITEFITKWHDLTFSPGDPDKQRIKDRLHKATIESISIRSLASNPLLLTMISILNRKQELPRARTELYEQASRILLHQWDLESKQLRPLQLPANSIGIPEKQAMLRAVAFAMQESSGKLASNIISETKLKQVLTDYLDAQRFKNPRENAGYIIEQLHQRNFILCSLEGKQYSFVHRTFLEYFCAWAFIWEFKETQLLTIEDLKNEVFSQHYKDESWHEVLRLITGLLEPKFACQIIGYLLDLKDSVGNLEALFLAADCLSEIRNIALVKEVADRLLDNLTTLIRFRNISKKPNQVIDLISFSRDEVEPDLPNKQFENLLKEEEDYPEIIAIAFSFMRPEQLASVATRIAKYHILNNEINLEINTDRIKEGLLDYSVTGDTSYLTIVTNHLAIVAKESEMACDRDPNFHLTASFIAAAQTILLESEDEKVKEFFTSAERKMQELETFTEEYASATLEFYNNLLSMVKNVKIHQRETLSIEVMLSVVLETASQEQISQIEDTLSLRAENLRLSAERLTVFEIQSPQDRVIHYLKSSNGEEKEVENESLLDKLDWLIESTEARSISTAERSIRAISRTYQGNSSAFEFLKSFADSSSSNPFLRAVAIQRVARFWKDEDDTLCWLKKLAESGSVREIQVVVVQEVVRGWDKDPDTLAWLMEFTTTSSEPEAISMILDVMARYYPENQDSISWMKEFLNREDSEIRETAIKGMIHCGNTLVEKQRYEKAIDLYQEIKRFLREADEKYKEALAGAFRDCANKLNPALSSADSKQIRIMTVSALDQANELMPLNSTAPLMDNMRYVWAYQKVDRFEDAIAVAEKLDKSNINAVYCLGNAYKHAGRYDEALEVCRDAIELNPGNFQFYSLLKDVHHSLGNYGEAIAALQPALESDSVPHIYKCFAYRDLCWLYVDLGRYEDSISAGEQAVELFPKDSPFSSMQRSDLNNLAATYVEMGDYDRAMHYINLALKVHPEHPQPMFWRCVIDIRLGNLVQAEKKLNQLIIKMWKPARYYFFLGLVHILQGRIEESQVIFQKASIDNKKFSMLERIRHAFYSVVTEDMSGIHQMQDILTCYHPPLALLSHEILAYTEILSSRPERSQRVDLLVQLIENYKVGQTEFHL